MSPDKHSKKKQGLSNYPFSERDQLNVIMSVLGSPSEADLSFITDPTAINYINEFPKDQKGEDFKKMFPYASDAALDLMKGMIQFNPFVRSTIEDILEHPFLKNVRKPEREHT